MRETASAIFPGTSSDQTAQSGLVRIIHFGLDDCHQITVLKCAGYSVGQCNSVSQLHSALQDGARRADVVVMVDNEGIDPRAAIFLTRTTSDAALILFQRGYRGYDDSGFDLVVRVFSRPSEWLGELSALIERRRSVRPQDRPRSIWKSVEGDLSASQD